MDDRIPTPGLEGRVKITKEDGTSFLAFLEMADNPSNPGTPISKATLLKDTTAAMFGLGGDAVPDDVLNAIKTLINGANANADAKAQIATGSYTGTGNYGASNPTSLTFGFAPKLIGILSAGGALICGTSTIALGITDALTTSYQNDVLFKSYNNNNYTYLNAKKSGDGKTINWYHTTAGLQFNESGTKYRYFAIA